MPQDTDSVVDAFKSHIDQIYQGRLTDSVSPGIDFLSLMINEPAPVPGVDFLKNAIVLHAATPEPGGAIGDGGTVTSAAGPDKQAAVESTPASQSEQSRQKLAVEALMANPAEMRKLFPAVLKDVSVNHNDHIDMYEIDQGLKNPQLAQNERDFLALLKQGYKQMSLDGAGNTDPQGVNAEGLAVLDKALNPEINEDPLYKQAVESDLWFGAGLGAGIGMLVERNLSGKEKLMGVAVYIAGAEAGLQLKDLLHEYTGFYKDKYDNVAKDYSAMEAAVKNQ